MAESKQDKKVEARSPFPLKPSVEALPDIGWLAVADLQVDYGYQHQPYASAIESLRKEYQEAHSGFILVNQRQDGSYWIIDGQTRQKVHQLLELRWIRAEILHGLTQAEEANVYLLKCINAKRMPVDFFLAEYMAKRPLAVLIHGILDKRKIEIESYASSQRKRGMDTKPVVTCVTYLKRMIHRDPTGEILGMTLDLIRDTWEYSGNTLTGIFLDAMHKLLIVHADEIDRKSFVTKLGGVLPEDLRTQALVLRMGTKPLLSVGTALQHVIIDLYNSGRQAARRITLDLHSAAQRYEEQRRFWAREIAGILAHAFYQSRRRILRQLIVLGAPVSSEELSDVLPVHSGTHKSRVTNVQGILKALVDDGLATRTKRDHSYVYVPTELGALVFDYVALEEPARGPRSAALETEAVAANLGHRVVNTHCRRGHAYTPENTYTGKNGRRACRECQRLCWRKYDAKQRRKVIETGIERAENAVAVH